MKYIVHIETATTTDEKVFPSKEEAVEFVFKTMAGWDGDLFRPVRHSREYVMRACESDQPLRWYDYGGALHCVFIFEPKEEKPMTEYDPQLTAGLEEDYAFLKMEIESETILLREYPQFAEMPASTEEWGLHWLVSLRAREYNIPMPEEHTRANILMAAREVARENRRRHAKQFAAKIRDDINEKYGKDNA